MPLSVSFQNPWNVHDITPLHHIPAFLQQAFIQAEDQRFYRHGGVDWRARAHALQFDRDRVFDLLMAKLEAMVGWTQAPPPTAVWATLGS